MPNLIDVTYAQTGESIRTGDMHHIKCPLCHSPDRCNCPPKEVLDLITTKGNLKK